MNATTVIRGADRLDGVTYDIRGPVLRRAKQLEAQGHQIIKLNLGNPGQFALDAPDPLLDQVAKSVRVAQGYSDSRGIPVAREAVAQYYRQHGLAGVSADDVYLGNGVSELIAMSLQALLNSGDEVLVPSPDYPLWTGTVRLCGGRPVHYRCDEKEGWQPDLDQVRSQISPRTRALVIITPNNPTGCVYSESTLLGLLDLARRHGLLVFVDEIYDQILYEGAVHHYAAALAPDLPVLSLGGLSKNYRLAGYRSGWLVVSDPLGVLGDYLAGLELLSSMRLCPNVLAQNAIELALNGTIDITPLLQPGGRLRDQRDLAWHKLTEIPGVDCVKPAGSLYLFPRLDPDMYRITSDERLAIDFLEQYHVMLSHGTGFNLPTADHMRVVFLAPVDVLDDALSRLAKFLPNYAQ